jgi:hypothetical protein
VFGGRWFGNAESHFFDVGINSVCFAARVVVIELDDLMAIVEQAPGEVSTQKASSSSYEVFHGNVLGVSGQVGKWTSGQVLANYSANV